MTDEEQREYERCREEMNRWSDELSAGKRPATVDDVDRAVRSGLTAVFWDFCGSLLFLGAIWFAISHWAQIWHYGVMTIAIFYVHPWWLVGIFVLLCGIGGYYEDRKEKREKARRKAIKRWLGLPTEENKNG